MTMPAWSRQSRVFVRIGTFAVSFRPMQERIWNHLQATKKTVFVHAKLVPLRYVLRNLLDSLVAAFETLIVECLPLLLWMWGIHYVCCCLLPHDFKHLRIALLHLPIHSRERGVYLCDTEKCVVLIYTSFSSFASCITMFLELESEMLEIIGHATEGCKLHTWASYTDKHMLYWGRVFSMKFDNYRETVTKFNDACLLFTIPVVYTYDSIC